MIALTVEGMTCMGCVRTVETVVTKADPAAKVVIDLKSGAVEIDSRFEPTAFINAIETAGFDVKR
jgi:copper chaperone